MWRGWGDLCGGGGVICVEGGGVMSCDFFLKHCRSTSSGGLQQLQQPDGLNLILKYNSYYGNS